MTTLKRVFHKILIRDLEVFRLVCVSRLTDFNEICQNEGVGGSPNADQIWRCCVNIWGYTTPKICIKTTVFAPQGDTIHVGPINATFGTAEVTEDPVRRVLSCVAACCVSVADRQLLK